MFVVAVVIPCAMAVPRALTRDLSPVVSYVLYRKATEENNFVCLNEYSKSTVTLGALNKTKVIKKKKISL